LNISKAFFGFPFINWIGYLPIIKDLRFFVHTTHLFAFSVAICAGMGIAALSDLHTNFRRGLLISLPLGLIITAYLYHFKNSPHSAISLNAGLIALAILVLFQLVLFLKDKKITPPAMAL